MFYEISNIRVPGEFLTVKNDDDQYFTFHIGHPNSFVRYSYFIPDILLVKGMTEDIESNNRMNF